MPAVRGSNGRFLSSGGGSGRSATGGVQNAVLGLDDVIKALRGVPEKVGKKYLRRGIRAGAGLIRDKARERTKSKRIKKALVTQSLRGKPGDIIESVGVKKGTNAKSFAHFEEFGTRERTVKKTGRKVGSMPARPFMRPTIDEVVTSGEVLKVVGDKIAADLAKDGVR